MSTRSGLLINRLCVYPSKAGLFFRLSGALISKKNLGDDFGAYLTKYIGKKATLALLLDYDGTLSPIAKHPDLAILPPETKKVLERLANRSDVFIAIVSGRSVDNVKKMVGIEGNFLMEFRLEEFCCRLLL